MICPRCGKEADIPEGDNCCSNCYEWVECHKCGTYHEQDNTVDGNNWCNDCVSEHATRCDQCNELVEETITVDDEEWCQCCVDNHTITCENCDTITNSDNSHRVGGAWWCDCCFRNEAVSCDVCGEYFQSSEEVYTLQEDELVCQSCVDSGAVEYCDENDNYFLARRGCTCGCTTTYSGGMNRGVAGYGCHGEFKVKNSYKGSPAFGLEMEVGNYPSRESRDLMVKEFYAKLGWDFAYPTSDSSLGQYGIEFIGHPLSALDHVGDERYDEFFRQLINSEAFCDQNSSGCHMTTDRVSFKSDDAVRGALAIVKRFEDALLCFTAGEIDRRKSYAKSEWSSNKDPLIGAGNQGKYSAVNIGKRSLVEFRIPGMQLDIKRHLAQIQLYHNLMDWCNRVEDWKTAGSVTFDEVFLPVLYQDSIDDVIQVGLKTGEMCFDPPQLVIASCKKVTGGEIGTVGGVQCVYKIDKDVSKYNLYPNQREVKPGDFIYCEYSRRLGIALDYTRSYAQVRVISRSIIPVKVGQEYTVTADGLCAEFKMHYSYRAYDYNARDMKIDGRVFSEHPAIDVVCGCSIIRAGDYVYNGSMWSISYETTLNKRGLEVCRGASPFKEESGRMYFGDNRNNVILSFNEGVDYLNLGFIEDEFNDYDLMVTNLSALKRFQGSMFTGRVSASIPAIGKVEVDPSMFYLADNGIIFDKTMNFIFLGRQSNSSQLCLYPRKSGSIRVGDLVITSIMKSTPEIRIYKDGVNLITMEFPQAISIDTEYAPISFKTEFNRVGCDILDKSQIDGIHCGATHFMSNDITRLFGMTDGRAVRFGDLIIVKGNLHFVRGSYQSSSRGYCVNEYVVVRPLRSGEIKGLFSNGDHGTLSVAVTESGSFKVEIKHGTEVKLCYYVR